MPHKRAKRSVRLAETAAKGFDNAPSAGDSLAFENKNSEQYGGLSKNMYRVLNAEKIRNEFSLKKRKRAEEGEDYGASTVANKSLKILPGESMRTFRNRVEESMRPSISASINASKTSRKKAKLSRSAQARVEREEHEASLLRPPPRRDAVTGSSKERESEFKGRETVRLNDVAMAPPNLKFGKKQQVGPTKLKVGVDGKVKKQAHREKELPISLKQKQELEEARTEAIARYRDLKARQTAGKDA